MSKFLKVIASVILCLGLIGSFILAKTFGYDLIGYSLRELNVGRFIAILAGGVLTTLISFGLLFGFAEVLDKLDEIIKRLNDKQ